VNSSSERSKIF
jgi:hypothetical protein